MGNPLVGDVAPFEFDEETPALVEEDALQTELAKIGADKTKWPNTTAFIKERQEFYRRFFPGGVELMKIPAEERGNWWLMADTIIREYDAFMDVVNQIADAKRRQPPNPPAKV